MRLGSGFDIERWRHRLCYARASEGTATRIMPISGEHSVSIPVGVVIRRLPGVTRWAKFVWQPVAILPGAAPADWEVMRKEGDAVEFHAATVPLELYRTDTEAYLTALAESAPCVYVVLRESESATQDKPLDVLLVTASPYEGQDYADTGEEIVEKVAMPAGLIAWIQEFVDRHHEDEPFIKRKRNKHRTDLVQDGIGDARITQLTDVYRAPGSRSRLQ